MFGKTPLRFGQLCVCDGRQACVIRRYAVPQFVRKLDPLGRAQLHQFIEKGLVHGTAIPRFGARQDSDAPASLQRIIQRLKAPRAA
jgi:hypothetical protein